MEKVQRTPRSRVAAGFIAGLFLTGAAGAEVILGVSYPIEELRFSAYHLNVLGVREFRFGGANWEQVEAVRGTFDWGPLDFELSWAIENNFSGMMTIASRAPDWACDPSKESDHACVPRNMADFRAFVDELVAHLEATRDYYSVLPLHAVQFGNEWPRGDNYPGPEADYVTQMNIVYSKFKAKFPELDIVLGGLGSGHMNEVAFCKGYVDTYGRAIRESFCAKEEYLAFEARIDHVFENAGYDIVDQHLYWKVEEWAAWIDALKNEVIPANRPGVPVVVSEFGGPNANNEPVNEVYHEARMVEYLDTVLALPVDRAYAFKLVESRNGTYGYSGLIDRDKFRQGNPNPEKLAYWVFRDFARSNPDPAPDLTIVSPPDRAEFNTDTFIEFRADVVDGIDGALEEEVVWSSDVDGTLGVGASVLAGLSQGWHTITAIVTNSRGLSGTGSVTVRANPYVCSDYDVAAYETVTDVALREARYSVTGAVDFNVADGGTVFFRAGSGVVLANGFRVDSGGEFVAAIDPHTCD